MYFGCPLLRALNNDGENVLFPRKATGTNYPCICELSCGIAAPGRPRFAVSCRLFAACPRAKPSELHCSLGFGARYSLLWAGKFCSLMKNVGSSIAPQAKRSIVPQGMSTGRHSLQHCSLAGQDLSCPHAPLLGRAIRLCIPFLIGCRASQCHLPPLHRPHGALALCLSAGKGQRVGSNIDKE